MNEGEPRESASQPHEQPDTRLSNEAAHEIANLMRAFADLAHELHEQGELKSRDEKTYQKYGRAYALTSMSGGKEPTKEDYDRAYGTIWELQKAVKEEPQIAERLLEAVGGAPVWPEFLRRIAIMLDGRSWKRAGEIVERREEFRREAIEFERHQLQNTEWAKRILEELGERAKRYEEQELLCSFKL